MHQLTTLQWARLSKKATKCWHTHMVKVARGEHHPNLVLLSKKLLQSSVILNVNHGRTRWLLPYTLKRSSYDFYHVDDDRKIRLHSLYMHNLEWLKAQNIKWDILDERAQDMANIMIEIKDNSRLEVQFNLKNIHCEQDHMIYQEIDKDLFLL